MKADNLEAIKGYLRGNLAPSTLICSFRRATYLS